MLVNKKYFIVSTFLILASCGGNGNHMPLLKPQSPLSPGNEKVTFENVKPIMEKRCFRCHSAPPFNWTDAGARKRSLQSGAFKARLTSKTMPQSGSPEASEITDQERNHLLSWVASETGESGGPAALQSANVVSDNSVDVVKDRNLAITYRCMGCHGPAGVSVADSFPNLASHGVDYIEARLTRFLSSKSSGLMPDQIRQIFKDFSLEYKEDTDGKIELSAQAKEIVTSIGQFFSRQSVSVPLSELVKLRDAFTAEQKLLYENGKKTFTARCASCHLSADLKPLPMAPNLFAQKLSYLQKRVEEFKDPSAGTVMPALINTLSKDELASVLVYVSHSLPFEK